MRRTVRVITEKEKAEMLDEVTQMIIDAENGVMTAPDNVVMARRYPTAWAGYKIMRFLFDKGVIEPGGAQETLKL